MLYHTIKPSPSLQEYIQCFFIWENESVTSNYLEMQSAPNGYTGMVINYGHPYSIWHASGKWEETSQSFVAGQFTKKYKIGIKENMGAIGAVFWPGAMVRLLKIPALEFTDKRIDLNFIFGNCFKLLEEQILECKTNAARIEILDNFFRKSIHDAKMKPDLVDEALNQIIKYKGILSVNDLSKNHCLSPRHFRRLFTDRVGVSPKMYSRIKRFNYISYLTINDFQNWQDLVYKGGFYDQAHFIKDFCQFTGKKPTEYINYSKALIAQMRDFKNQMQYEITQ